VAHHNAAVLLLGAGKLPEALAQAQEAVRLSPRSAAARDLLGRVRHAAGAVDEAIACFQKALDLDPTSGQAAADLDAALNGRPLPPVQ
jgi:superkiller protein 3